MHFLTDNANIFYISEEDISNYMFPAICKRIKNHIIDIIMI